MTKLEEVAKALCPFDDCDPEKSRQRFKLRNGAWVITDIEMARAAILALRNPTPRMIDAGCQAIQSPGTDGTVAAVIAVWQAMIDVILGEAK